jgi:MFS superfamily sulfate permease-like transporter
MTNNVMITIAISVLCGILVTILAAIMSAFITRMRKIDELRDGDGRNKKYVAELHQAHLGPGTRHPDGALKWWDTKTVMALQDLSRNLQQHTEAIKANTKELHESRH